MKIRDIVIDAEKTVGTKFMLVDVNPYYKYENQERTDEIDGYKYSCVLPERKYQALNVKIKGEKRIELKSESVPVVFNGLLLKGYIMNGTFGVTAEANDVKAVKN